MSKKTQAEQDRMYLEQIEPLMKHIATLADEYDIPFLAVFQRYDVLMEVFEHFPKNTVSEIKRAGQSVGVFTYEKDIS